MPNFINRVMSAQNDVHLMWARIMVKDGQNGSVLKIVHFITLLIIFAALIWVAHLPYKIYMGGGTSSATVISSNISPHPTDRGEILIKGELEYDLNGQKQIAPFTKGAMANYCPAENSFPHICFPVGWQTDVFFDPTAPEIISLENPLETLIPIGIFFVFLMISTVFVLRFNPAEYIKKHERVIN